MTRPPVPNATAPLVYVVVAALLLGGGYLLVEFGRYQAGYSILDQRREQTEAERLVAEKDAELEELRRQIALLETSRDIDHETYAQVEANLSELQARIQAQEEELVFLQGIVSPEDGVVGLRIQSLELTQVDSEQRYMLNMVLVQAIIHDRRVAGGVRLRVAGTRDGEETEFALEDLVADGGPAELAYGFRYFQALQQELLLPVGFEPDRLDVEIWPQEPRGQSVRQSFRWSEITTD